MLLLGLFLVTGAAVDSKVGDWFRNPGPTAVSASMAGIDRVSVRANAVMIRVSAEDRPDLSVTVQGGTPGAVKAEFIRQGAELHVNLKQPWWHNPYMSEPATVEVHLPASFQAA
ncbi:MAG TPA: hypothetical protein VNT75_09060, partial [Symbiobacteriaceae bacterium]|nr:hypothetical protein [Symbiobacteriaceae bacterium]